MGASDDDERGSGPHGDSICGSWLVPSRRRRLQDAQGGEDGVDQGSGACSGDLEAGDRFPAQITATAGASPLPLFAPWLRSSPHRMARRRGWKM